MKNLDSSISNKSILDESFNNIDGRVSNDTSVLPDAPVLTDFEKKSLAHAALVKKFSATPSLSAMPTSSTAPHINKTAASVNTVSPIASLVESPSQARTDGVFMGGGGGGASDDSESNKKSSDENKILGMKPILAYGLGASILVLAYFKFIKKAF